MNKFFLYNSEKFHISYEKCIGKSPNRITGDVFQLGLCAGVTYAHYCPHPPGHFKNIYILK